MSPAAATARLSWRFKILCLVLGLVSLVLGDWVARKVVLGRQVAQIEALRSEGGRYIVNDIRTKGYRPEAVTAVFYGDSSNDSVPERDRDKRFISQMLHDQLRASAITVAGVSFPGNAVDWMSSHLRYEVRQYPGLEYVVVPLNLRWISPGWRGLRRTLGARRAYELHAAGPFRWVFGVDLPYRGPPPGTGPSRAVVETVAGPVEIAEARLTTDDYLAKYGGDREAARRHIGALRLALSYGLVLTEADPFFTEVDRIARTCRTEGITCLFYLPPFNLGLARAFLPKVADRLEANLRAVRSFAVARGYRLLDLSGHLAPENFHDHYNEHVDEVGRRLIAGCLAKALEGFARGDRLAAPLLACRADGDGGYDIAATKQMDLEASAANR